MIMEESEKTKGDNSSERSKVVSDAVATIQEKISRSRDSFRDLSLFTFSPIAKSSPMHCSNEIVHLKSQLESMHKPTPSRSGGLFLRPLPATNYYGRPALPSHLNYTHCGLHPHNSVDAYGLLHSLMHTSLYRASFRSEPCTFSPNYDKSPAPYDQLSSSSDKDEPALSGILKKRSQSIEIPSSSDSAKEINVYSGGVLIMQNYKEPISESGKEKISEVSAKLIEDCQRLSESLKESEVRPEPKMVQFDVGLDESLGAQSSSQSPTKDSNGNSTEAAAKSRDQPSSLSTNDSLSWQPVGPSSPSSTASARRLEWDSGADIGYLNVDLSKDKLSTIERVILKGIDKQGVPDKKVVFRANRRDRVLERMPSDLTEQEEKKVTRDMATSPDTALEVSPKNQLATSDGITQTNEAIEFVSHSGGTKSKKADKPRSRKGSSDSSVSMMKDQSTLVNTLGDDYTILATKNSESSETAHVSKASPRTKKLTKRRPSPQSSSLNHRRIQKIIEIVNIGRSGEDNSEAERRIEEIIIDHSYRESAPEDKHPRPTSASSGSNVTVLPKEDKPVQTSDRAMESKAVQVSDRGSRLKSSKNIQASGELNSLPKHLDKQMLSEMSGREVRTKCTQFFGEGANSLPKALTKAGKIRVSEIAEKSDKNEKKAEKIEPGRNASRSKQPEIRKTKVVSKDSSGSSSDKSNGLTVEVMRKRHETVDPTIMRKKFFDSQERLMISKGTSMDPPSPAKDRIGQLVSVGIQYSPKEASRGNDTSGQCNAQARDWTDTLESQASSTQTAHSWVHEGAPRRDSVVRPTRSFEYLPGDVYESSANLREKLPSDASQNAVTECSSSVESDPAAPQRQLQSTDGKPSMEKVKESNGDGVHTSTGTIVLEDSPQSAIALHGGAWVLIADEGSNALELVRKPSVPSETPVPKNGVSIESGSSVNSKYDRRRQLIPCSVAIQTEANDSRPSTETLKRLLRELLAERRHGHSGSVHSLDRKTRSSATAKSTGNNSDRSARYHNLPPSKPARTPSCEEMSSSPPSEGHPLIASTPLSSIGKENCLSKFKDTSAVESNTLSASSSSEISAGPSGQISEKDSGCRIKRGDAHRKKDTTKKKNADTQCDRSVLTQATQMGPQMFTQATQMGQSLLKSSRICRICFKDDCQCDVSTHRNLAETGTQMSSSSEGCVKCHKFDCDCSPHGFTETGTQMSWTLVKCGKCGKADCACLEVRLTEMATQVDSPLNPCERCGKERCVCRQIQEASIQVTDSDSSRICQNCSSSKCICRRRGLKDTQNMGAAHNEVEAKTRKDVFLVTDSDSSRICRNCSSSKCTCRRRELKETQNMAAANNKVEAKTRKDVFLVTDSGSNRTCDCSTLECSCRRQLKETQRNEGVMNNKVFHNFLDVDLSSPEVITSGSHLTKSSKRRPKSNASDKENAQCSVCACVYGEKQLCIFCACHVDKYSHIPRCDCHENIVPRFLLPGFCKCHRRNKQYFGGCKCSDDDSSSSNCICCEYFFKKMRDKVYSAHIDEAKAIVPKAPAQPKPKNYFLKLEETDVSKDSTDVSEPEKKPVEIITIKIPVKRCGKLKVPSQRFYYEDDDGKESSSPKENEVEYLDDIIRKYTKLMSDRKSSDRRTATEEDIEVMNSKKSTNRGAVSSYRSLQEWLESNRPDFCSSAESRRRIIVERARERETNQHCKVRKAVEPCLGLSSKPPCPVPKRIFTTAQLKQQTQKRYKRLTEVTKKKDERKKREEYRTNKLMAEIFAKKLQLKTLRGEVNLSNSLSLISS